MRTSDISEKGLETLLVDGLCQNGWKKGEASDYSPADAVDLVQLAAFLEETQPAIAKAVDIRSDSQARRKFLARLHREITSRGVTDVLRNGLKHQAHSISLYYATSSHGNALAHRLHVANRFTVVRQLHYSATQTGLSLDVCLMLNGLPVVTMELKNLLTKQNVADAVEQYKNDRDPRESIFAFKRAVAHFAIDDQRVQFSTRLEGKASWFLPFDQGHDGGAGNPPNPDGIRTAYLWERLLTRKSLIDILENYTQVIEEEITDRQTKKVRKRETQVWPRYHQLDVVRKLLADAKTHGAGKRYLIQHSAGSGKSNSIAWLVHQLIRLDQPDADRKPIFDTAIVVTNRRILDRQINETIGSFAQVGATVGHARTSKELHDMIVAGKKIIITTIQKFPFIVSSIGDEHRDRNFAIVIDEAHDSQAGKTAAALSKALQGTPNLDMAAEAADIEYDVSAADIDDEEAADEDPVQEMINQAMESRKMATNASYFAFTATPKNKTLEMFGVPFQDAGKTKFRPFHTYSMKQAIAEGFILDVLSSYTTVDSYYRLVKTVESDPEFDTKRAKKKLRAYVEGHDRAIAMKAGIVVEHFLEQVAKPRKIGGEARAMVVCGSIRRAISYHAAITKELEARGGQFKAIVAFSGEHDYGGKRVSEASINGFPSGEITERIQQDPYRILVCADKFQTGYDEPLLHTMYVDKILGGVKAVQTLSRLNRSHPKKHDVFVLDFQNDADDITEAFAPFYRTTVLSDETDANKLHDLQADLDAAGVYHQADVDKVAEKFLSGSSRTEIDPILDTSVDKYGELDEDGQVRFKGGAKAFVRTYDFLGSILPYSNSGWEKLSIFLNLLTSKLPAPQDEDLSKGILDAIDMDSYRAEKQVAAKLILADEDGEIDPIPAGSAGGKPEAEIDRLSNIIRTFNDLFGNIDWSDKDRIGRVIAVDLPRRVNADERYQNAKKHSDKENARIEHDRALNEAIHERMGDESELFIQFSQDEGFKHWLRGIIFEATYASAKDADDDS